MLPSAEEIKAEETKVRILSVEPWVVAHIYDLWQQMKKGITEEVHRHRQEGSNSQK